MLWISEGACSADVCGIILGKNTRMEPIRPVYAGGIVGEVRTNRPLSGRGPRGYMRLHGAWPPCMAIASGLWSGSSWPNYFFRRLNMKSHV